MTNDLGSTLLREAERSTLQRTRPRADRFYRDDMTAETVYQFLLTQKNHRARSGLNDKVVRVSDPVAVRRYISTINRNVIAKSAGQVQSADRWALTQYLSLRADAEQLLGRMLTVREEDLLAEDVRLGQRPKHRATAGFHRHNFMPTKLRRVDLAGEAENQVAVETDNEWADGSIGAGLEDRLATREITKTTAKADLWDALAERAGAPLVARRSLRPRHVKKASSILVAAGGVERAANDWLHRRSSPIAEGALLAPFGTLTEDACDEVAELVLSVPHRFADRLHQAALIAAA